MLSLAVPPTSQLCFEQLHNIFGTGGATTICTQGPAELRGACRFGVLNKVVLLFPEQWWDTRDTFGHVVDPHEEPGWFYLWYCFPGISGAWLRKW